jgi:general transcription factor 3C polypeptide 5 (transcription factor C subunit 1)
MIGLTSLTMAYTPPTDVPLAKPVPFEHKFFYSIEYPGYVAPQSVSKAINRLGGPQIVTDTFRRGLKVDLKLKDNEPYAHPPNGQVVTTQNLVMKVVRRRRKSQGSKGDTETGSCGQFTVQVLGLAQKTLRFRSECAVVFHLEQRSLTGYKLLSTFSISHQRMIML